MKPVTTFFLGACTAVLCQPAGASARERNWNGADAHRSGVVSTHAALAVRTVYGPDERRYLQLTNTGRKPMAVLVKTVRGDLVHRVYLGINSRQRLTLDERVQEQYLFEVVSGRSQIKRLVRQVARSGRAPLRLPDTIPGEAISGINAAQTAPANEYTP